jgi:RHS repeat-associated protein
MRGYDARGNRTSMTHPSGTTATFGFDAENRMTSAVLPTTWQDDTARQYVPVPASRIVDTTTGAGTCDGAPCARLAADDPVAVKVTGVGGVPATGVTAVVVSIIASGTTSDGWLEVNPAGDAAAGTLPLNAGQTSAQTVTAKVAANGTITLASGEGVDLSVDVVGYFRAPSPWVPALNYWPLTPTVTAESTSGTGVCDASPCGTLPAGETDIATAGHGGIPASGVNAVTVSILAQHANGGQVRVAPSGDAAAGELVWETGSVGAAGVFTVPLNPDGTITLETAGVTSIRVAVTGYWKVPTGTDTGLGLDLLEAPTRLVDTTTSTGMCDNNPCDTLQSNTPVEVAVTGQAGLSGEIMAVMVSVTAINPTGTGVLGVGTTEADLGGGIVVFDPAQHASTTMIIPLTGTGTFTIGSWTETDVAVDVIGVFRAPTRTWRYEYDTTGMRTAKQLDDTAGTGVEWRKEHTWTASGGLPLLLAEHQGAQSAYVIYGPGGTPIYQINTTGEVQYFHQDHQGSTRLTTNANGTTRNTITYNAHGEITANTNWWLEQPLNGYTGQYHDPETGYIYLRARHYDPTTGQFTTVDPLLAITEEPYGYVGGNVANRNDPLGLYWGEEFVNTAVEVATQGAADCLDVLDANCETIAEQHPEGSNQVADTAGGYLNAVTLGLGEKMFDDEVSWGSSHAQMGSLLGAVMLLPLAVGSPAGWGRYAAASGALSCMIGLEKGQGVTGNCASAGAMFLLGSYFQSFSNLLPWWAPAGLENVTAGFLAWFVDCAEFVE